MNDMENRRQFTRILFSIDAQLEIEDQSYSVNIHDISLNGALVSAPKSAENIKHKLGVLSFNLSGGDAQVSRRVEPCCVRKLSLVAKHAPDPHATEQLSHHSTVGEEHDVGEKTPNDKGALPSQQHEKVPGCKASLHQMWLHETTSIETDEPTHVASE